MAAIRWTREAERWLQDIFEYISQDNPVAAVEVVLGIYDRAQILETHPKIGHRYEGVTSQHVRILLYGHYRIAYLILDSGDIDILGVFHGAMQIGHYLSRGET